MFKTLLDWSFFGNAPSLEGCKLHTSYARSIGCMQLPPLSLSFPFPYAQRNAIDINWQKLKSKEIPLSLKGEKRSRSNKEDAGINSKTDPGINS